MIRIIQRAATTFRRGVAVLIFFVFDPDHPEDPVTCKEDGLAQQLLFANKPDHRRQGGFITLHLPKEGLKIANCKCLLFCFHTFPHLQICTPILGGLVEGSPKRRSKEATSYIANCKCLLFSLSYFFHICTPTPSLVGGWRALSLFVATLDFCAVQAIWGGGAIMAKRYPGDLHWQALEIFATRLTLVLSKGIILGQNNHYRSYAKSRKSPWQAEAIPFSLASIGTMGRSNERTVVLTTLMLMSMMMMMIWWYDDCIWRGIWQCWCQWDKYGLNWSFKSTNFPYVWQQSYWLR